MSKQKIQRLFDNEVKEILRQTKALRVLEKAFASGEYKEKKWEPKIAAEEMRKIAELNKGAECCHAVADTLLCEVLSSHGYDDMVAVYNNKIPWY
jgi:hypothetical protein